MYIFKVKDEWDMIYKVKLNFIIFLNIGEHIMTQASEKPIPNE